MQTDHQIIVRATEAVEFISTLENDLEDLKEKTTEKRKELAQAIDHLKAIFAADENDRGRPLLDTLAEDDVNYDEELTPVSYGTTNSLDTLVRRKPSREGSLKK